VLQRYRTAALAWAVGLGAVAVTAMLPFGSPLARGLVAFVAGMTVATAWLVVETVRGVRRRTSEPDTAPAVQRQA
jgi:hypothetical protein